jgi:hypothetical protein
MWRRIGRQSRSSGSSNLEVTYQKVALFVWFTNYIEVLWGVDNESHCNKIFYIYLVLVSRTVSASVPWWFVSLR